MDNINLKEIQELKEKNKFLEDIVTNLLDKITNLEESLEILKENKINEVITFDDDYFEEKEYLPLDQKVDFVHKRLMFVTSEIAKINKEIGRHDLYYGEVVPIEGEVNKKEILVVCADYPHKNNMYGGAFIPARVRAYKKAGYNVSVCIAKYPVGKKELEIHEHEGVKIYIGDFDLLEKRLREVNPGAIVVHSPILQNYNTFKKLGVEDRLIFIYHGFEVRDVGHLYYNFDEEVMKRIRNILQMDMNRKILALEVFRNKKIAKVFVSNFFKNLAINDIGVAPFNVHVISNLIESDLFNYVKKKPEDRLKIFSIRPFDNKNYGGDLIVDTILRLSEKSFFKELSFHVQGFGKKFKEMTAPLRKFDNVKVVEGILRREDIAKLHKQHGIALIPTRFDTQGVSVGEAMSSGLVPVTNKVAAIPEFVPENCAMLAEDNNVEQLAKGIEELYHNPDMFLEKSFNAAQHIRKICSPENTVNKEIELINKIVESKGND
ncbi:glycosyltransferase family 4 protein [Caminibacter pacificus]